MLRVPHLGYRFPRMEHNTNPHLALGAYVRGALAAAGVPSVRAAALRAGMAPTTLERRLAGDPFRLDELESLATMCGTTASTWIRNLERDRDKVPTP